MNNERTRTMVYSNVNKKADKWSASRNKDIINLDKEVVLGLEKFPEPKGVNKRNKKDRNRKSEPKEKNKEILKNNYWEDERTSFKELSKNKTNIKNTNKKKLNDEIKLEKENTKVSKKKISNADISKQKEVKQKAVKQKVVNQKPVNQKALTIQQKIKTQKIRALKKMTACFFLIVLLIGGFVYFLLSPVFNIKSVEVLNNNTITKEQIINVSGIKMNENMFKISTKEIKNNILANPYIESVKVKRKLFNTIQIDINERMSTLMLEYGNSFVYINNQGYILEIKEAKLDAPILTGYVTPLEQIKPGNRLSKDDLERLKIVLSILESANSNELEGLITKIDINNKKNYKLIIESEDKIVHLGTCSDLSTQMLFVKEMLEREKGIEGEFFVDMDLNERNPVFREKV